MRTAYFASPEFHRNLWMRFTPAGAGLIAAMFVLMALATGQVEASRGVDLRAQTLFFMYFFVVAVWGNYAAAFSMREEMKDNTWDFLRVSAISPAQLAFGKLFGATSFAWYLGLLVVGLYYWNFWQDDSVHMVAFYMLMSGLMGHATAFLISMSSVPASTQHMAGRDVGMGTPAFLTGCGVSMAMLTTFLEAFIYHYGGAEGAKERFYLQLVWYGQSFEIFSFWAWSSVFGLFWLLLGSYRLVRAELMFRVTPVAWMIFLASLIAWTTGFAYDGVTPPEIKNYIRQGGDLVSHIVLIVPPGVLAAKWAFFISAAICYLTMLSESSDVRKYARLGGAIRRRDLRGILDDLPRWVSVLPYVMGSFAALWFLLRADPPGEEADTCLLYFMLGTLLFIVRDGMVLHLFHVWLRRRAAIVILGYFLCVAAALPSLLLSVAHGVDAFKQLVFQIVLMCRAAVIPYYLFPEAPAIALFFPTGTPSFAVSVMPAAVQAAVAALIFLWFVKRRASRMKETVQK